MDRGLVLCRQSTVQLFLAHQSIWTKQFLLTMTTNNICVVSYNLHGFNQGAPGVKELMVKLQADVIMIQEHWLSRDNLSKLNSLSDNYFVFGSSAMDSCVSSGPLVGRPFGGTAMLVNKKHVSYTTYIVSSERYTAIKINNWLLITVYMPCIGSLQRDLLYDELLSEVQALIDVYVDCDCLIGGDFNVDLDNRSNISAAVLKFIDHNHLHRCEQLFPSSERNTYFNDASNTGSAIDYMLTSSVVKTIAFNILDLDINLSDHLPIMSVCTRDLSSKSVDCSCESQPTADVTHLRWDHAPLDLYHTNTPGNCCSRFNLDLIALLIDQLQWIEML